jgi:outer membrane protein
MRRFIVIFLALSSLGALAAPPKIALVRISDIYSQLPSTKSEQSTITALRAEILKDPRADELRKLIEELKTLHVELQRLSEAADPDTTRRDALAREYEIKRSNMQSLQQDFEAFRLERTSEINRQMVEGMRISLNRIAAAAQKLGSEKGFDWVLDSSGSTNTGLPFILYSKGAKDLTDDLSIALSTRTTAEKPPAPPHKP